MKTESYIEISQWDKKVRITFSHHDVTAEEMVEQFINAMKGIGYAEKTIKEYIKED